MPTECAFSDCNRPAASPPDIRHCAEHAGRLNALRRKLHETPPPGPNPYQTAKDRGER